jgi:hypothetical protein
MPRVDIDQLVITSAGISADMGIPSHTQLTATVDADQLPGYAFLNVTGILHASPHNDRFVLN